MLRELLGQLGQPETLEQQFVKFASFSRSLYDSGDDNIADMLDAIVEDLHLFDPKIPILCQAAERLRRAAGPALPPPPPL